MDGNLRIGWFGSDGKTLHGYGKDSEGKQDGLYEQGLLKENGKDVELYFVEIDFIAESINFDKYIFPNTINKMKQETNDMIDNLPIQIRKAREKVI